MKKHDGLVKNTKLVVAILNSKFKTQRELAVYLDLQPTLISGFISGRINPRDSEKADIARALNVSVNEIFAVIEEPVLI